MERSLSRYLDESEASPALAASLITLVLQIFVAICTTEIVKFEFKGPTSQLAKDTKVLFAFASPSKKSIIGASKSPR